MSEIIQVSASANKDDLPVNMWYGIEVNESVADASNAVTRIGNTNLHSSLPVHSKMVAALINDDESVNKYLNPTDWNYDISGNAVQLDGSQGQVMIKIPSYYERIEVVDANKYRIKWSTLPLPGFTYKPSWWIGAYLGRIDANGKLQSVADVMPTTNKHRDEFRQAARLRGSTNWCLYPYDVWSFLNKAVWIKYKTLNGQLSSVLNAGATNASVTDWNTYNAYNPVVATGLKKTTNDSQVAFSVSNWPTVGAGTLNSNAACFYGIEHVFGYIWQWVDGLNIHHSTANRVRAFICSNPGQFADDTLTNYTLLAVTLAETSGYVKTVIPGTPLVKTVGGSDLTYYSDYHYTLFNSSPDAGWRGSFVGGALGHGTAAGLACLDCSLAASRRLAYVCSRLCLRGT